MLKEKHLVNQKTFRSGQDANVWFDENFEFQIKFDEFGGTLYFHEEIDGKTIFIKRLRSLNDLANVYEAITELKFV